jgi:hypothetical protein
MRGVESKRAAIGQQIGHAFTLEITVGLLCPEPWVVSRWGSGPHRTSIIPDVPLLVLEIMGRF